MIGTETILLRDMPEMDGTGSLKFVYRTPGAVEENVYEGSSRRIPRRKDGDKLTDHAGRMLPVFTDTTSASLTVPPAPLIFKLLRGVA